MTASTNPLVDHNARFEWGDYIPGIDDGSDHGGTGRWDPFTEGQGYTTGDASWSPGGLLGLPVLDDAVTIYDVVQTHATTELAKIQQFVEVAAAAFDIYGQTAATETGDWGGTIVAPITSWTLEHVKPLRLLLDEVTGNQDTVNAVGNTWLNMAGELVEVAHSYERLANDTDAYWTGDAAEHYRSGHAYDLLRATSSLSLTGAAFGELVKVMGVIVGIVHGFIRDLIAAAIGQLVQDVVEAATVVGIAAIPEQSLGEVARLTGVAAKAVAKAVEASLRLKALAAEVLHVVDEILKIIQRRGG